MHDAISGNKTELGVQTTEQIQLKSIGKDANVNQSRDNDDVSKVYI